MVNCTDKMASNVEIVALLAFLMAINSCFAAKVSIIPMFGRSHYMVLAKLAEELHIRGHEVTIFLGEDSAYAAGKPYVKLFNIPPKERDENQKLVSMVSFGEKELSPFTTLKALASAQQKYCDMLIGSQKMIQEIQSSDVLIGESLYPCSALIADKFDLLHVVASMGPVSSPFTKMFGVDGAPSYVPQNMAGLSANSMSLKEKIKNLGFYIGNILLFDFTRDPSFKELKEKHKIKPNKSIKETMATADLVLLLTDFAMDIPEPLSPYVREVGFLMPSPAKPLPADLEDFVMNGVSI